MNGADVRHARQQRGWTQADVAQRLGVSQAYVCLLERGRRTVPRVVAAKLTGLLPLAPTALSHDTSRDPLEGEAVTAALGALGYPGFAHVRARRLVNPGDVVLRALQASDVDARGVEALPWVLRRYPDLDWTWLLPLVKVHDLQNRLGFVLAVARRWAELQGETETAQTLTEQERVLERSKLQREDTYRASMPEAERRWLRAHRPPEAMQWNMLSTVTARELAGAL